MAQLICEGLRIPLITAMGIRLAEADPVAHPIEGKDPLTVIARLAEPVDFPIEDHRLMGLLHIPAEVEEKRLVHHVIGNLDDVLKVRRCVLGNIAGDGITVIDETDSIGLEIL
jgi:hypothetical protein